jgi:hypothetical protein
MAESSSDRVGEGKLDLVPMIDCIMLLLLFFILTTTFKPKELALASLLSTKDGPSTAQSAPAPVPQLITLGIAPAGMAPGLQPSQYAERLRALMKQLPAGGLPDDVELRLGGDEPLAIGGAALRDRDSPQLATLMAAIHDHVFAALERRERPGAASRKDQDPVVIRCFSRLPWKFALIAYDAVRDFEASKSGSPDAGDPASWDEARRIDFAPPLIRIIGFDALGEELGEIVNQR